MKKFIEDREHYPARFGRQEVERLFPGIIKSKTLAELASRGEGPPFVKAFRRAVYERDTFLQWLDELAR